MVSKDKKANGLVKWLVNIFLGAFIGVGAILPGLSGGVMCVVFGVYQPLMETLAHPLTGVKKNWRLLVPVVVGVAVGFVCFGKALNYLLGLNTPLMQAIFVGLILGTLPSFWKEAGAQKRTGASWITLAVSFVAMFLIFAVLGACSDEPTQIAELVGSAFPLESVKININANFFWFMVCGAICGISIIVPGMSFSSPLMCLGLFDDMTDNLSALLDLDWSVIPSFVLPLVIGALATVLLLAKPVNWLFDKYNSIAYHFVFGTLLASTVLLIPYKFDGVSDAMICLAGLVGGCVFGYTIDVLQSKVKRD